VDSARARAQQQASENSKTHQPDQPEKLDQDSEAGKAAPRGTWIRSPQQDSFLNESIYEMGITEMEEGENTYGSAKTANKSN